MAKNYNLQVNSENIDSVILKLTKCSNVEIRNIIRRSGLIQVKAETLEAIACITEVLNIEKDKKFYINYVAIL